MFTDDPVNGHLRHFLGVAEPVAAPPRPGRSTASYSSSELAYFAANLSLAGTAISIIFVATRVSSRQKYACRDKCFVATKIFCDNFSRQTHVCRDKTFVATEMEHVPAPASDANPQYPGVFPLSAICGHAWLDMVASSLIWQLTCPGR